MFKRISSAILISVAALMVTGCTTSGSSTAQLAPTEADLPDMAFAPVPATKPDSADAKSSITAEIEDNAQFSVASASPAASKAAAESAIGTPELVQPSATELASADAAARPSPSPDTAVLEKARSAPAAIATASAPDDVKPLQLAYAAAAKAVPVSGSKRERECLMRAMYFESNRSSRDGQLAVGTVVMHRLAAGNWGRSVCGVVGAPRQFAPGVMSRRMQGDTSDLAALADSLLAGKRHPKLPKNVMFFHQAGLKFPYKNMKYVHVAGGNTFYFKSARRRG